MPNVKLKDKEGVERLYDGITKIVLKDANNSPVIFSSGGGGRIEGGHNVSLIVDGEEWQIISVGAEQSIQCITSPTVEGKAFIGWAASSSATVPDITFPITPTEDISIYAVFVSWRCTVANLGASDPTTVTFTHQGIMPEFEEVTVNGDVFIKIPTMYRKITGSTSEQITSFVISVKKEDVAFLPYPCFVKSDGVSVMPYILIGKYCSTSNLLANSIDGGAAGATLSNASTLCANKGTGYQLYDWQTHKLWQDLLICKMQTVNTNSGAGVKTDVLGISWYQGTSYTSTWINKIRCQGSTGRVNIIGYYDSTEGIKEASTRFDYTQNQNISKLGYSSSNEFFNFPIASVSDSDNSSYYCDNIGSLSYGDSTSHNCYFIFGSEYKQYGAFHFSSVYQDTNTSNFRLCYRPINE